MGLGIRESREVVRDIKHPVKEKGGGARWFQRARLGPRWAWASVGSAREPGAAFPERPGPGASGTTSENATSGRLSDGGV